MESKKCNKCGKTLPVNMFIKNNQKKDGLYPSCKTCLSQIRKKWDHKYNLSDKAKATAHRYYYSEKGQKTKIAYRKAYILTEEQKEKYREAGRNHEKEGRYKDRKKRYDQSPKGKATKAKKDKKYKHTEKGRFTRRKVEIKRKHQITSQNCTITKPEWDAIKERFSHRCAYCNREVKRLEMDHVIPLSKGGAHTKENIVPACRTCNAKKGNREQLPREISVLSGQ